MDKLFFNEYIRKNSYFPRSKYEHPDNPSQEYRMAFDRTHDLTVSIYSNKLS